MRRAAIAALACVGCNRILGLGDTQQTDAVLLGPPPTAQLTYQVASTPGSPITFPAIGGTVSFGLLDGPLTTATPDATGTFVMSYAVAGQPYRIVYQLPNDPLTYEVQWQVPTGAHFTVPSFDRVPLVAPPVGSGYQFNLTGLPPAWTCAMAPCIANTAEAAITGVWYQGHTTLGPTLGQPTGTSRFTPDPTATQPLTPLIGTVNTPRMPAGDLGVFISFVDVNDANTLTKSATAFAFASANMIPGGFSVASAPVVTNHISTFNTVTFDDTTPTTGADARLNRALGPLTSKSTASVAHSTGGVIPETGMPMASLTSHDGTLDATLMIQLSRDDPHLVSGQSFVDFDFANPFTAADQGAAEIRPTALLHQRVTSRRTGVGTGPTLFTGYQEVSTDTQGTAFKFDAGIATSATFVTTLTADATPVTVPRNAFANLDFTIEAAGATQSFVTTDCVVTLYAVDIAGNALTPARTITVPTPSSTVTVHIPTSDFTDGGTYAFGIVCRNAYPNAAAGDYVTIGAFPQSESQIFPGTFVVTLQ